MLCTLKSQHQQHSDTPLLHPKLDLTTLRLTKQFYANQQLVIHHTLITLDWMEQILITLYPQLAQSMLLDLNSFGGLRFHLVEQALMPALST